MYERMLNKQEKPTLDQLYAYCGKTSALFQELQLYLLNEGHTTSEVRFPYGKSYGWCTTHRIGKKLICDMFAEEDAFTVMLRLSDAQFESVYDELMPYAKELVDHKYPCGGGGWIHYRVTDEEQFKDIKTMLGVKCK